MNTSGLVLFISHAKQMVILFFLLLSFLFYFYFLETFLSDNISILQATVLRREPSPMKLFVETHVRSDDSQKEVQQFVDSRA
jgi:hypothetical protein